MDKKTRVFLTVICAVALVISAGVSVFAAIYTDPSRLVFGEWLAPVNINIEIDKNFAQNFSVMTEPMEGLYWLSPTSAPAGERVIIHTELRSSGFYRGLFLRVPEDRAQSAIRAVDNISVFIGNKVYYFPRDEIREFEKSERDGYALFRMPRMYYAKSLLVKDWVNYYGDLNMALNLCCAFFFSPGRFIVSWIFLCGILFLYRKELFQKYREVRGKKYAPLVLLAAITVFAFLTRINGFVRHSAWSDELYSAALAANPGAPFLSVFMDSGNPPGYYLLLKYWFKLAGWNEAAGTLLSVLLGTLACPSLYLFLKKSVDTKTALIGAFFMAVSGFAGGYSQEMRGYILMMALAPFIAFLFLRLLKKLSLFNLAMYVIPCVVIANVHYYGPLFVMANFVFYCGYCVSRKIRALNILKFLAANIVTALSLTPFFFYKIFVERCDFYRDDIALRADYAVIFAVLAFLTGAAFMKRGKIAAIPFIADGKKTGWAYIVSVPALVFMLSFLISLKKPLIDYTYLARLNYPFLLAVAAAAAAALPKTKTGGAAGVLLVWLLGSGLYGSRMDKNGGNAYEYYRESRRYITLDAGAHPGKKAAMLDNTPYLAAYYHEPEMRKFSPNDWYDVIYVFNCDNMMHQYEMYDELLKAGLDDSNMLKIIPDGKIVIFKLFP